MARPVHRHTPTQALYRVTLWPSLPLSGSTVIALTGSAVAALRRFASASGVIAHSGTATAQRRTFGAGSTIIALSGSADGTVTSLLSAPIDLEITGHTSTSVNLAWTAPAEAHDNFEIGWRSIYSGTWNSVSRTPSTTPSQSITGLPFNSAIEVRVRAMDGAMAGSYAYLIAYSGAAAANGILGFGDSITAGIDASTTGNRWLNLLAGYRGGLTINNEGIGGTVLQNSLDGTGSVRTDNGRDRFDADVLNVNFRADLTLIAYGLNDTRYEAAPATLNLANFIADYREILNGLLAGKDYSAINPARIILASPTWIPDAGYNEGTTGFTGSTRAKHETFVAAVAALAEEYGVGYMDAYATIRDTGGASHFLTDNIHPEDSGHAALATGYRYETTYPSIKKSVVFTSVPKSTADNIILAWSAPIEGGAVTNYTVEYGTRGAFSFPNSATASGTTHTFSGVATGEHVVRIRANFADGSTGPWTFGFTPVHVHPTSSYAAATVTGEDWVYGLQPAAQLESRAPQLGAWTVLASSTASRYIIGNKYHVGLTSGTGTAALHYALGSSALGNGVFSEGVFKTRASTTAYQIGVFARLNTGASPTGFIAIYNGTNFRILKLVSGTATTLATHTATVAANSTFTLRLECSTNSQKLFLDGTQVASSTEPDSGITGHGEQLGIRIGNNSGAMTDTTGLHLVGARVGTIN